MMIIKYLSIEKPFTLFCVSHSAIKACHPKVMMFYFAADNNVDMKL